MSADTTTTTDDRAGAHATVDEEAFDRFVRPLDPPLVIVTTIHDGERTGCIVGFHTQCSIEPRRYAVWISKANHTYRLAIFAEHFAIHVVDEAHRHLAELFGGTSGDEIDKFERCAWSPGPGGVPLLDDLPNWVVGRRVLVADDGSDHVCVTIAPDEVATADDLTPIRASELSHLRPGHRAEDIP